MNSNTASELSHPYFLDDNTISSDYHYRGTPEQCVDILLAMKVKQNSIFVNGKIVIRKAHNRFEVGSLMGDFRSGTLQETIQRLS